MKAYLEINKQAYAEKLSFIFSDREGFFSELTKKHVLIVTCTGLKN